MEEVIKELKRDDSLDYLKILKSVKELPFLIGRNTLVDLLTGNSKNKSIKNTTTKELLDALWWQPF